VEGAGFVRTRGNTSWWGTDEARVERFEGGYGWQVLRSELQARLAGAAADAGVEVRRGRVREVRDEQEAVRLHVEGAGSSPFELRVRHVLDASGRAGVLARHGRQNHGPATLAISAVVRRMGGFPVPDDTHTLVESHEHGWAWSVPTAPGLRHVTVMLDPPPRSDRPRDVGSLYARELLKVPHLRRVVQDAEVAGAPWAADASGYTARVFARHRWALVGDAASFIDPLSSFGVKKALFSGWLAAVAAHTALRHPGRAELAAAYFSEQERSVFGRYAREAARYAAGAAARHPGSAFWSARARGSRVPEGAEADQEALATDEAVRTAFEAMRSRSRLHLRLGDGVRILTAPAVVGHEIAMTEAVMDQSGQPVHFIEGVAAAALARLALRVREVGALAEAYQRAVSPVALGAVLRALATLLAAGLLRDGGEDGPSACVAVGHQTNTRPCARARRTKARLKKRSTRNRKTAV
jgi:flavin-dependent dehydrogenase